MKENVKSQSIVLEAYLLKNFFKLEYCKMPFKVITEGLFQFAKINT